MLELPWKAGKWRKGKKTIKGRWFYHRAADRFMIEVFKKDSITGDKIQRFNICGDTPEWNGWKLERADGPG